MVVRRLLISSGVLLLTFAPAFAWNDRGHMLIAMIAYQELKPEVRDKVNAILKAHPQRDLLTAGGPAAGPDLDMWVFAKAATWPDMIRSKNNPLSAAEHRSQWHYINHPVNRDGARGPEPVEKWDGRSDPANIVQAQAKCRAELAKAETAPDRRAMDLCWVEHLVGDIHQPLHAVALFSKQFPQGDRGGNSFAVKRGESPMNLHSFWDNALGTGTNLDTLKKQVEGFRTNPKLSREALLGAKPSAEFTIWTRDSVEMAKKDVYLDGALKGAVHTSGDYPKDTPALPADYEARAKATATRQITLAAYRLADVLNAELGSQR